jgi:hypothetical protein
MYCFLGLCVRFVAALYYLILHICETVCIYSPSRVGSFGVEDDEKLVLPVCLRAGIIYHLDELI